MKNTVLYIAAFLFVYLNFTAPLKAEEGNLMIILDRVSDDRLVMEYPNGTTYKVLNTKNLIVEGEKEKDITFYRADNYQLIIYPTYKKSPDIFELENQQIQILKAVDYSKPTQFHQQMSFAMNNDYGQYLGNVKMDKLLVRSKLSPEEYNCVITLSNGIVFSYINGEAAATFYDEMLDIKGKYVFECELGITKLSYNPKNGQVWYVFEPKDDEQ